MAGRVLLHNSHICAIVSILDGWVSQVRQHIKELQGFALEEDPVDTNPDVHFDGAGAHRRCANLH